jgi:hypothetical protein
LRYQILLLLLHMAIRERSRIQNNKTMRYINTKSIETLEQIKKDYEAQIQALYSNENTVWDKETGELEDSLNNKVSVIFDMIEKEKKSNEVEESEEDYINSLY